MTETAKKEIPSGEDSPCLPAGTSRPTFSEVVNRWKEGVGIRTRGNFETIVRRWAGKGPKAPMPEYRHEEISEFYRDVLQRVSFDSSEVRAMETVLKFLDENGDCSSLTTQHPGERERTVAPFVREIYAQVPLWQHTLNVAREALRIQGGHPDEQAKGVIAALAHDLGKARNYYDTHSLYAPHSLLSLVILSKMEEVTSLPYWEELKDAVWKHHTVPKTNPLLQLLIDIDGAARKGEMRQGMGT